MKEKGFAQRLLNVCACLMLLAGVLAGLPLAASAEGAIRLDVQVGINGEFKESALVPVRVTVANTGPDVEGELVVTTDQGGLDRYGTAYYQPVSVARGATKQVTIAVPGEEIRSNTRVAFLQDGQVLAQAPVNGRNYHADYLMIGVLAQDPNTANFFGIMKDSFRRSVKVLPMKAEQVPNTATQLNMIDMLVLNNFALDTLSAQQIEAIREWTKTGGMLVLAGGAQYPKTVGTLEDLSPVDVRAVTSVQELSSIKAEDKRVELTAPFTVSRGEVREGRVLYAEGDIPLLVTREAGAGKVLYVAYDLAAEPLASWSGNAVFWPEALSRAFGSSLKQEKIDFFQEGMWELSNASERIPALKMPEVGWFALLFGIYALIAGPILFFVLRAKRKQSYMWVIVPALAVVTGVGMFSFGAMQRGTGVLVHQAGFVELIGDGQANVRAVTAMFVPKSGDYQLTVHGSGATQPYREGGYNNAEPKTWARLDADQAEIRFRDVEFWSMRKAATQQVMPDAGDFAADLSYSDGTLQGTITNNTKFTLRDVRVVSGSQVQDFAEMAPGSTVQVKISFQPSSQFPNKRPQRMMSRLIPQASQSGMIDESREGMIVQMMERNLFDPSSMGQVMIAGWTDQPVVDVSVGDMPAQTDGIALVTASLPVKPSQEGMVFYPASLFEAVKSDSTVDLEDTGDGYYMDAGEITFDIDVTLDGKKLQVNNLYLYTWSDDGTSFGKQVYNWQKKAFEPYEAVFVDGVMKGEQAGSYLSADGVLRIKFAHHFQDQRHIGIPSVMVEGKVITP